MPDKPWTQAKRIAMHRKVSNEATKSKKRMKSFCVFMVAVFVDDDGTAHTITGGQTIHRDLMDLYRNLMIAEQRRRLEEEDGDGQQASTAPSQ